MGTTFLSGMMGPSNPELDQDYYGKDKMFQDTFEGQYSYNRDTDMLDKKVEADKEDRKAMKIAQAVAKYKDPATKPVKSSRLPNITPKAAKGSGARRLDSGGYTQTELGLNTAQILGLLGSSLEAQAQLKVAEQMKRKRGTLI